MLLEPISWEILANSYSSVITEMTQSAFWSPHCWDCTLKSFFSLPQAELGYGGGKVEVPAQPFVGGGVPLHCAWGWTSAQYVGG